MGKMSKNIQTSEKLTAGSPENDVGETKFGISRDSMGPFSGEPAVGFWGFA